ncbi:MAG: hypothetical protein AB7E95_09260 [Kiritimatiellales bacterium]|jgi:hypothetical protein
MKEVAKLPLGCLAVLLIAAAVWIAAQFILVPALEKDANRQGHTLKDYTDRLFHGR